jgi:hypothetical protein
MLLSQADLVGDVMLERGFQLGKFKEEASDGAKELVFASELVHGLLVVIHLCDLPGMM